MRVAARWRRYGWRALGLVCVALGIIGALVPLMPTTIFLILAAGCFSRSSPALERWLLTHPRFGPTIVAWRRERVIPPRAKALACTGMAVGLAIVAWHGWPRWWPAALGLAVILPSAIYVLRQRSHSSSRIT